MAFCDFVVRYDPETDSMEEVTKRILYSIYIKRLKAHKPAITFIGGDSGEGKSWTVLRFEQLLLEIQGIDILSYVNAINIYTPLQYPEKMDKLLFDKELKKVNIIGMHEAREVVKAKMWQNFLPQAVADVNAMSRTVKRMALFIISQFIRDITNDIRYTLNYYAIVRRPKGKPARLYFNVLWKDDRDLEKPKLRKRKLSGYLVYPNGDYKRYVPSYFEMSKPPAEIIKAFEKADTEAKVGIIKNKLQKMIDELKTDIGEQSNKVTEMLKFYQSNPDSRNLIGRIYRSRWRLKKEAREMHNLSREEALTFEREMGIWLKQEGAIQKEEEEMEV